MLLDMNNNKEAPGEMRERKGRRESREIPEREVFERAEPRVRRKVSRVESLRRLILGASHIDSKRLFDRKKQRLILLTCKTKT